MVKQKLLDQVRDAIRTRHLSYRTEQPYVDWIKQFILFHNKRHPDEMDETYVSQFLTFFAVKKKVVASTQNQALSAILFLYRYVSRWGQPLTCDNLSKISSNLSPGTLSFFTFL